MISAAELIAALEAPAALFLADGSAVGDQYGLQTPARPDPIPCSASLSPERHCKTIGVDGVPPWSGKPRSCPVARALVTGRPATAGFSLNREHHSGVAEPDELRTPLNGVLGMADLLADTDLAKDQRNHLTTLQACAGRHLLGLVNDVLDMARLDAGQAGAASRATGCETPAAVHRRTAQPRAHAKGIEIAWSTPADLPIPMADEGRLQGRYCSTSVGNAVKFTEKGGVLLGVELAPGDQDDRLRDPLHHHRHRLRACRRRRGRKISKPLASASAEHAARTDSTGLGLAIVRCPAAAHAGRGRAGDPAGRGRVDILVRSAVCRRRGGLKGPSPGRSGRWWWCRSTPSFAKPPER